MNAALGASPQPDRPRPAADELCWPQTVDDPSRVRLVLAGEASRVADGDASFQLRDPGPRRETGRFGREAARGGHERTAAVLAQRADRTGKLHRAAWRSWTAPAMWARSIIARTLQGAARADCLASVPSSCGAAAAWSDTIVALRGTGHRRTPRTAARSPGSGGPPAPGRMSCSRSHPRWTVRRLSRRGQHVARSRRQDRRSPKASPRCACCLLAGYVARAKVFSGGEPVGRVAAQLRDRWNRAGLWRRDAAGRSRCRRPRTAQPRRACGCNGARRLRSTRCSAPRCSARFSIASRHAPTARRQPSASSSTRRARPARGSSPSRTSPRRSAPAASAFLKGLTLLANQKFEAAANEFRDAIRASPDFYPAMVYLGACYAAGGTGPRGGWCMADRAHQTRRHGRRACPAGRGPAAGGQE